MKRILLLLAILYGPILASSAQVMKPCGTSVLSRRHRQDMPRAARATARSKAPAYTGEKRGLIILVEFPDQHFQSDDPRQTWDAIANEHGYSDNGGNGSVSDYFSDQSYGQFRLTFDVVGPVEAKHDHAYYGANKDWGEPTGWFDQNVAELVEEACRGVADHVSFADYDWDDDGEVEQVFMLYAGHGENDYWYRDSTVIWPHMATLAGDWEGYEDGLVLQDRIINVYACSNEINRSGKLAGMGTFCHEFSHCLGLPDLYNTEEGGSVLGLYDVMDQGNYNGGSWCPVGYSSYERYACGWLEPQTIDDPSTIVEPDLSRAATMPALLMPLHESPDARIWRSTPEANDYYLIEYRVKESWDTYIPKAGILVWHIDYDEEAWAWNTVNNDPDHLRVEWMRLGDMPTGIRDVRQDDGQIVAVYDLQGRLVQSSVVQSPDARPLDMPSPYSRLCIVRYADGTIKKCIR